MIQSLEESLATGPCDERSLRKEIENLKLKREFLLSNPNVSFKSIVRRSSTSEVTVGRKRTRVDFEDDTSDVSSETDNGCVPEQNDWKPTETVANSLRRTLGEEDAADILLSLGKPQSESPEALSPKVKDSDSVLAVNTSINVENLNSRLMPLKQESMSVVAPPMPPSPPSPSSMTATLPRIKRQCLGEFSVISEFEKKPMMDYKLPSLSSIEKYVTNEHEVPLFFYPIDVPANSFRRCTTSVYEAPMLKSCPVQKICKEYNKNDNFAVPEYEFS